MRRLVTAAAQQTVLDAAAELQLRRSAVAKAVAAGEVGPHVRVVARGPRLNAQMIEESARWGHLLSVRESTSAPQLRVSLPNNRSCLAAGLTMTSVFDLDGATAAARALLRRERPGVYYFGWAPLNLKIIDLTEVLLQGPDQDGHSTVIAVNTPGMVHAAMIYWKAVLATAEPAWGGPAESDGQFTDRQQRILELLSTDLTDQAIGDVLGVSLRTVRYDIAAILEILGVSSRFAAGLRLGLGEGDQSS